MSFSMSTLARFTRCAALALLAAALLAGPALARDDDAPLPGEQKTLLDAALNRLPAQRPGVTDMYVLGVAGDASEDVFRNEVTYLQQLSAQRWNAAGRMVSLINQPDNRNGHDATPQATIENLRYTLDALGQKLDPRQDVLFLYMSSHGTHESDFYLQTGDGQEQFLGAETLKRMLDEAGIGNAVVVVSACYSGRFVSELKAANHMVISAARKDRPSFGCGNTDTATWFGRAFLVEALNATNDFSQAFTQASATVREREREEQEQPSQPQFYAGADIVPILAQWRARLPASQPVPYPFTHVRQRP